MSAVLPTATGNPFVGPRAFRTGERLYGRGRETQRIVDLLIAERIVLLYSPSGAGKTSLINAALVPELQAERFQVSPVVRVGMVGEANPEVERPGNRYLLSTLMSLEESVPAQQQRDVAQLVSLTLDDYLHDWALLDAGGAGNELLVFDQFEEILTSDPTDEVGRRRFFAELGDALRDRGRWALLAMREEFVAGLDPYLPLLPTKLRTRIRLELLHADAALPAIQKPATAAGREISDAAARRLVDELRLVNVQRGAERVQVPGPFVEPVQLQVVCSRLWQAVGPEVDRIDVRHVDDLGDVERTLGDYYAERVATVAADTCVPERLIRDWFDDELITPTGFRSQLPHGPRATGEAEALVVGMLEDAHLVRAEHRRGTRWVELSHDRLVEPVRSDNARWRDEHLSDLQRQAARWQAEGRRNELLLAGGALDAAATWVAQHNDDLTDGEREFWTASVEARRARRRQQRAVTVMFVSIVLAIALAGAIAAAIFAIGERQAADRLADVARSRQLAVVATTLVDERSEPALLLALEGVRAAPTDEALSALAMGLTRPSIQVRERWAREGVDAFDLTFGPAGSLATLGDDGSIRHWDLADGAPRGDPLTGHDGDVDMFVLSPAGRLLATASEDGTIRVWDATSGELRGQPSGSGTWVSAMAFSPDESLLAAARDDGTVQLWDVASGAPRGQLVVEREMGVSGLAFNPDATLLATVDDEAVQLWDVASGRSRRTLPLAEGTWVFEVAFSSDGTLLATGGDDGVIRLWDVATGQGRGELPGSRGVSVTSLAFSRDGEVLVSGDEDGAARLWDVATQALLSGSVDGGMWVAVAPDGDFVAGVDADGALRLWEIVEIEQPLGDALLTLEGLVPPMVMSMAFSPDGSLVASGRDDGTVRLWEVASGDPYGEPLTGHSEGISSVAFSPAGAQLVAAAGWEGAVLRWDLGEVATDPDPLLGPTDDGTSVLLSTDGSLAASGGEDGAVRLWDVVRGEARGELRADEGTWVSGLAFSPDGSLLATIDDEAGTVRLWDVASGEPRGELRDEGTWVSALAFSPDGSLVAAAGDDGVVLLDVASGEPRGELRDEGTWVSALAFSPDGTLLAAGDDEAGTVQLWDVASGEPRGELRADEATSVWTVGFSPDGSLVAAAGGDGVVRLWDVTTGDLRGELVDRDEGVIEPEFVTGLALSPDGSLAVSVSDGTARLWDAVSGDPRGELLTDEAGGGPVSSVTFTADGASIVSWGDDEPVSLWDVATGKPRGELLPGEVAPSSTVVSPDGSLVVTLSEDSRVRLWDVASGELRKTLRPHDEAGAGPAIDELVALAPDGTGLVAIAGGDLQLWDLDSGEALEELLTDIVFESSAMAFSPQGEALVAGGTEGVAFTADGQRILAWGWDGAVHVWEAASGERVLELMVSPEETLDVSTVALHEDRLVSIHWDGTLRLWDAVTGESRGKIETGQEAWLSAAAFNLSGGHAATAADDGSLRVLPSDPVTWIGIACETVSRNLSLAEWHARIGFEPEYVRTCANHPSGAGAPPDADAATYDAVRPDLHSPQR